MVSEVTRFAVWDTLCDLEANVRYCVALSDQRQRFHKAVRLGLLVGITLEGGLLFGATQIPWLFWVGVFFGLLLAVLTIWDAMSNYAADAATLKLVGSICVSLKLETDFLWRRIENGLDDEDMVEQNLQALQNRMAGAMGWIQCELNLKLQCSTEEQANAEMTYRYVKRL